MKKNQSNINKTINSISIFEHTFWGYISSVEFSKLSIKEREYLSGLYFHIKQCLNHETTLDEYDTKNKIKAWLNIILKGAKRSKFYKEIGAKKQDEIQQVFDALMDKY